MPIILDILNVALPVFILHALIIFPGLGWASRIAADSPTLRSPLRLTALALAVGLPLLLVPAVLLAELGLFRNVLLLSCVVVVAVPGWWTARAHVGAAAKKILPVWAALSVIGAALVMIPNRGEWILGGWDPGVNMNQGLMLSRCGSWRPAPDPAFAALIQQAPEAFSRHDGSFIEAFPGIPVDATTGALAPYFYRLTPTLIAIFDRVGGIALALHANLLVGLWTLLILTGLLSLLFRPAAAIAGIVVLMLQPIFLYHTHNPASESVELLLVCALGFLWLVQGHRSAATFAGLVLLLALFNRSSFILHGALLAALAACDTLTRPSHRFRTANLLAALLLGAGWYAFVTPASMDKLQHLVPSFLFVCALAIALALIALLASSDKWRIPKLANAGTAALALVLLLITRQIFHQATWQQMLVNLSVWGTYTGWGVIGVAVVGLVALPRAAPESRQLMPWLGLLLVALVIVLVHRHVAPLYPWATKRWLAWSPLLAAIGAAGAVNLAGARFGNRGTCVALIVVALALAPTLSRAKAAWLNTEYDGARYALSAVAEATNERDIIISDHFMWATPLNLAFGRAALNADPLCRSRDPELAARVAKALRQMRGENRRVLLLTSTQANLGVFPPPFNAGQLVLKVSPQELRELIQHRNARNYEMRTRNVSFSLYEWGADL